SIIALAANGETLTAADFGTGLNGGPIKLNDDGRAVVIVGTNGTGAGTGITAFDVYFVQDISSGPGQTWRADKVASINSLTAVGIDEVIDNLQDGISPHPVLSLLSSAAGGITLEAFDPDGDALTLVNTIPGNAAAITNGAAQNFSVTVQGAVTSTDLLVQDPALNQGDSGYTLVQGTAAADTLSATQVTADNAGLFYGFGGDDVIRGTEGVDHIYGGADNDHIVVVGSVGAEYLPVPPAPAATAGLEGDLTVARAESDIVA